MDILLNNTAFCNLIITRPSDLIIDHNLEQNSVYNAYCFEQENLPS